MSENTTNQSNNYIFQNVLKGICDKQSVYSYTDEIVKNTQNLSRQ